MSTSSPYRVEPGLVVPFCPSSRKSPIQLFPDFLLHHVSFQPLYPLRKGAWIISWNSSIPLLYYQGADCQICLLSASYQACSAWLPDWVVLCCKKFCPSHPQITSSFFNRLMRDFTKQTDAMLLLTMPLNLSSIIMTDIVTIRVFGLLGILFFSGPQIQQTNLYPFSDRRYERNNFFEGRNWELECWKATGTYRRDGRGLSRRRTNIDFGCSVAQA